MDKEKGVVEERENDNRKGVKEDQLITFENSIMRSNTVYAS